MRLRGRLASSYRRQSRRRFSLPFQSGTRLRRFAAKPALSHVEGERNPEPDPELRDTESVPLSESIEAFFEREVKPHVPDAWIETSKRDEKDGKVGIFGYEINFNRYFYR